ncbi:hypothetical protein AVEN_210217-1 [Araneus ventricosus]|uniref:Uncharacterized protein n=1 Tax=Araneus ventricosus TaxID=182803 RepID=A0A4Y2FW06_ARAVE|nr:hypothetical protein AVEN_210217-1 [Araneus ventricosus]
MAWNTVRNGFCVSRKIAPKFSVMSLASRTWIGLEAFTPMNLYTFYLCSKVSSSLFEANKPVQTPEKRFLLALGDEIYTGEQLKSKKILYLNWKVDPVELSAGSCGYIERGGSSPSHPGSPRTLQYPSTFIIANNSCIETFDSYNCLEVMISKVISPSISNLHLILKHLLPTHVTPMEAPLLSLPRFHLPHPQSP